MIAPGKDDVVRRQDGQRAAARAAAGDKHAAGLGNQRVTFRDAGVAGLQRERVEGFVGVKDGQVQGFAGGRGEFAAMAGDAFPAFGFAQPAQARGEFVTVREQVEIGPQLFGVGAEQGDLFVKSFTDARQPAPGAGGGAGWCFRRMTGAGRGDGERFADAAQDSFAGGHARSLHQSLKL